MPASPPSTPSSTASADSGMSRQAAAAALIDSAGPATKGKLNREEYQAVLDKYFMA